MFASTLTACALYMLSARQECRAAKLTDLAYCNESAAFWLDIDEPADNVAAELTACKGEVNEVYRECLSEVTEAQVCY